MTGALGRTWIVAAALAAGIVLRPSAWLAAGGLLLFARRAPALTLVGLVCSSAALGGAAAARHDSPPGELDALARRVPRCVVSGVVREHHGGLGSLVGIRRADCGRAAVQGGAVITPLLVADPGAPLRARGRLTPLGDDDFDRARRRLGGDAAFEPEDVSAGAPGSPPLAVAARIRTGLRKATDSLDPGRAALVRGLTIGDTRGLPATAETHMRRAGLTHLVAVSGSNVAIVLGALLVAARRLRAAARIGLAGAGLALFVLVVGPEPSVLRAAAMGGAGLAALVVGTRGPPLHALGLAVVVVLALRPALVYSPGLQLSVAATAGIVLWASPIADRIPLPAPVAAVCGVTLAAQAAVVPVLVLTFGEVPLAGLPANILAVPVVPVATVLGFICALAGAIHPDLGEIPARLAEPFAAWIIAVGDRLGAPEWASVALPAVAGWGAAAGLCAAAAVTLSRQAIGRRAVG